MLSFALSSVYYHCNFLCRQNYSLLYQINLSVLDYRMYSIVQAWKRVRGEKGEKDIIPLGGSNRV
jgi:hypothetical protein